MNDAERYQKLAARVKIVLSCEGHDLCFVPSKPENRDRCADFEHNCLACNTEYLFHELETALSEVVLEIRVKTLEDAIDHFAERLMAIELEGGG